MSHHVLWFFSRPERGGGPGHVPIPTPSFCLFCPRHTHTIKSKKQHYCLLPRGGGGGALAVMRKLRVAGSTLWPDIGGLRARLNIVIMSANSTGERRMDECSTPFLIQPIHGASMTTGLFSAGERERERETCQTTFCPVDHALYTTECKI